MSRLRLFPVARALILAAAVIAALPSLGDEFTGTPSAVTEIGGRRVARFRTATQDINLDFDRLPEGLRTKLSDPKSRSKRFKIDVDPSRIVSRTEVPFGVRPDCNELPVTVEELDKLAKDKKIKNMVEFLNAIPPGTLQGFTFVTNSLSAQRGNEVGPGKVSSEWPRVLRGSIDGKLTISFVCDPQNPTFGKVEVIAFNDKTNEFETTEWEFGTPEKPVAPDDRVHKNLPSCLECHSGSTTRVGGKPHVSIKLNWPEYFFWGDCQRDRGITFFGASDDNLAANSFRSRLPTSSNKQPQGCTIARDREAHNTEVADWQRFRDRQKDNPCFNTLPWAKTPPDGGSRLGLSYQNYPFAVRAQDRDTEGFFDYSLRTNARFTDAYSHLASRRNHTLLKQDRNYEAMKYFLVMEEAGCINEAERDKIRRVLGRNFEFSPVDPTTGNVADASQGDNRYSFPTALPILYSYAKSAGLQDHDWSMEFKLRNDPNYNAVMFEGRSEGGNDSQIYHATVGGIFQEIRAENPRIAVAATNPLTRGVAEEFGPRFSCIDENGGRLRANLRSQGLNGPLCTLLRAENDKRLSRLAKPGDCVDCRQQQQTTAAPAGIEQLARRVSSVEAELDQQAVERGRRLVAADSRGKCVLCHSSRTNSALPPDLLFVPNEQGSIEERDVANAVLRARAAEGDFFDEVARRVVETKGMPPGRIGMDLTDQDREDILVFMRSLNRNR